ncbi:MAG: hypothetical protein KDC07_04515 [Chitinophagaceae bacterium]|nr:hypothetical protein [Chitinophagaceae bacterium]
MIETIENGVNTNAFIIKTDVESELFFRELTKSIPQKIKNERLRREFQIGIILNIRGRRDYELFEWFAMHRELAWGFYNLL